jgi:hypothetical protein
MVVGEHAQKAEVPQTAPEGGEPPDPDHVSSSVAVLRAGWL